VVGHSRQLAPGGPTPCDSRAARHWSRHEQLGRRDRFVGRGCRRRQTADALQGAGCRRPSRCGLPVLKGGIGR